MNVYIPRRLVILQLSEERGRSSEHPLTKGLISQWAADLGFERGQRGFTPDQVALLRWVNRHYASGGSRRELLDKLKQHRRAA